jgi:hypothetical protein
MRPIQDGHFFGADVHQQVVDAHAVASGHEVLHGVDLGALVLDGGGQTCVGHGQGVDGNFHGVWQIHPAKHNACVHGRRAQRDVHTLTAMQPHADGMGVLGDGGLGVSL